MITPRALSQWLDPANVSCCLLLMLLILHRRSSFVCCCIGSGLMTPFWTGAVYLITRSRGFDLRWLWLLV